MVVLDLLRVRRYHVDGAGDVFHLMGVCVCVCVCVYEWVGG